MATRSPLRSSAGPETVTSRVSISAATMCASVDLPSPGRPGQQHVVDRLAALLGGGERDRELLAHDLLADELVELARPQRAIGLVLVGAHRLGGDQALVLAHTGLPRRSAASPTLTRSSVLALGVGQRRLGLGHREAERDERIARREVRVVGRRRAAPAGLDRLERRGAELVAQLDDDPLRGALADAGDGREQRQVAGRDRRAAACRPDSPRAGRGAFAGPSPDTPSSRTNSPRSRWLAKP